MNSSFTKVEAISMPSRDTFEKEFLMGSKPVIFKNAMSNWRALEQWNRDYFHDSHVGKRPVAIEKYNNGDRYGFPIWGERVTETMPLRDYVDIVFSDRNKNYYLADQDIDWLLPELLGDIERPPLFDRQDLRRTTFYLGRDTISAAHYHPNTQVILCQVIGRKRFVFFTPEDGKYLSALPWFSPNFNWSQVDFDAPDVNTRYPLLSRARRIEAVVEPGDMIFVPVHWWHLVYGEGFSVSVTYIWAAKIRDWSRAHPGRHTVAAALVNNSIVGAILPPSLLSKFNQANRA